MPKYIIDEKGKGTREVTVDEFVKAEREHKTFTCRQAGCPDIAPFQITKPDGWWIHGRIVK
jgi:hypothetical protein